MRRVAGRLLGVCGALLIAGALRAQGPPFGREFRVDEHTAGIQVRPSIAAGPEGTFVIAWQSYGGNAGTHYGVFAQRFDGSGSKVGPEIPVAPGESIAPAVASDPAGNFVVAWQEDDGDAYGVRAQRYDHAGNKLGSVIPVNEHTTSFQGLPSIGMDAAGNFVIVWVSFGQDGPDGGVFGRRFDSAGTKLGSEFQVNTYTTDNQTHPRIGVDPEGGFVVAWESAGQDGSELGIYGQRFDSLGVSRGGEFRINSYTTGNQFSPSIAVDRRGSVVVVWESRQEGGDYGIRGQRFDVSGEPVGAEFGVNTYTTGNQEAPAVAFDPTGGFGAVWHSDLQDGEGTGIRGQRFDRFGAKEGTEFPVNTYTTNDQRAPDVAIDERGTWLVAWDSFQQDGDDFGVYRRRGNLRPQPLRVDAHTSGQTVSDGDGVLEPGETVLVEPGWRNVSNAMLLLTGAGGNFTGPPSGTYTLLDPSADYRSIPGGAAKNCFDATASHDCYRVSVAGSRPATHWDARFEEDVSTNGGQIWKLHIGDSFTDVPRSQPFYRRIETLLHYAITSGCTATTYCPDGTVARSDMAIFIAKGIAGTGPNVPTAGRLFGSDYSCKAGGVSLFSDVSPTDGFCRHVHYLALQNVTLGCNTGQYCPNQTVTRDAMASLIAKAIVAPAGGNAVPLAYGPDPNTGLSYSCDAVSPNIHFSDVPASHPFCRHIHFLWAKGIVTGCSATQFCPGQPVHRDAMAKFIASGFGLELYGP